MEDLGTNDIANIESDFEGLVRESSTAIYEEGEHLVYDRTRFIKDKIRSHFNLYYIVGAKLSLREG